ncbi:hypothetical protein RvVAR031_01830 [Agrobacterium vitis]|nr:hypothetical protein RvVAR031_01830 [Agrobacterium vitis]
MDSGPIMVSSAPSREVRFSLIRDGGAADFVMGQGHIQRAWDIGKPAWAQLKWKILRAVAGQLLSEIPLMPLPRNRGVTQG